MSIPCDHYSVGHRRSSNIHINANVSFCHHYETRYVIACSHDEHHWCYNGRDELIGEEDYHNDDMGIIEFSADKFFKFIPIAFEYCNKWYGTHYNADNLIIPKVYMDTYYDLTGDPKTGKEHGAYAKWNIVLNKISYNDWDDEHDGSGIEVSSSIIDVSRDWPSKTSWTPFKYVKSFCRISEVMFKEMCKALYDYINSLSTTHKYCGYALDEEIGGWRTANAALSLYEIYRYGWKLRNRELPELTIFQAGWFMIHCYENAEETNLHLCQRILLMLMEGTMGEVDRICPNLLLTDNEDEAA